MEGKALDEALEHDRAAKENATIPPEMMQAPVPMAVLARQLDDKVAVLSKTVSLGMLDTARTCMALAMQPISQKVTQDTKGNQKVESIPPKPETVEKWLSNASIALELAQKSDVLGDRPLARETPAKG